MDEMASVMMRTEAGWPKRQSISQHYFGSNLIRGNGRVQVHATLPLAKRVPASSLLLRSSLSAQLFETSVQLGSHGQAELLWRIVHMGVTSRRTIVLAKPHRPSKLLLDRLVLFISYTARHKIEPKSCIPPTLRCRAVLSDCSRIWLDMERQERTTFTHSSLLAY